MIKQIGLPLRGRPILLITRNDYGPNWTPLSPVTITYYIYGQKLLHLGPLLDLGSFITFEASTDGP